MKGRTDRRVIVITGPTASGKTSISIELSKLMRIEVISADSRQIYKFMDIGTATPSEEELRMVKTYFINILEPDQYYSAGKFGHEAEQTVERILRNGNVPVVVGGSGLYIKSLCEGFFSEEANEEKKIEIEEKLNWELKEYGLEIMFEKLKRIDPVSANKYNDMNPRRIVRALGYYELTGEVFSKAHELRNRRRNFTPIYFGVEIARDKLYERINRRSEFMWNNGLIEETKRILEMGYSPDLNSMNTVGYKEATAYLNGAMSDDEALEEMKKNTRRYAKRQMTWLRKIPGLIWVSGSNVEIAGLIANQYERSDKL